MAYTVSDEDEYQQKAQAPAQGSMPQVPYGQAPVQQPGQAPAPARTQSPSGFISFDRFLGSNYGKAHGAAQGISSQVGAQAQGAQDAVNAASQNFATRVKAGGQGAAYNGPTDFDTAENLAPTEDKFTSAVGALGNTASIGGLQNFYSAGGAAYTPGMSRFDAALANGAGRRDFEDLRQKYAGLDNALTDARTQAALEVRNAQRAPTPTSVPKNDVPQREPGDGQTKQEARRDTRAGGSSNQHIHHDRNPADEWDGSGTEPDPTDVSGPTTTAPPPTESDDTETQDEMRRDARGK